jgi:hypothetical protein
MSRVGGRGGGIPLGQSAKTADVFLHVKWSNSYEKKSAKGFEPGSEGPLGKYSRWLAARRGRNFPARTGA